MKYDNIKGIILDYDGSVDVRADRWTDVLLDAFHSAGMELSRQALKATAEAVGTYLLTDNLIQPTDDFTAMMRTTARLMLKRLADNYSIDSSFSDTPDTADAIVRYCLDYMGAAFGIDRQAIESLSGRCPLVLVSRYYPNFGAMLDEFGLSRYFRNIIQSDDNNLINRGIESLGLPADRILVIGRSLADDIVPALAAGCRALWLAEKSRAGEAPADVAVEPSLRAASALLG